MCYSINIFFCGTKCLTPKCNITITLRTWSVTCTFAVNSYNPYIFGMLFCLWSLLLGKRLTKIWLTASSLGRAEFKHFNRLESNFIYQQKSFRDVSLTCCMGWVPLKNQIVEEKAPIHWCACSMRRLWYSDSFSVSFILIQIWSINSDLTWSQWEFCQANSGAEIMKDFGIWPALRDYMDQNSERTNPLLSSFWASIMWFGPCCLFFF